MAVTTNSYSTGGMDLASLMRFYNEFVLPMYQRDYSWEDEQVQKLIDDIDNLGNDSSATLFLGQFVFANKTKGVPPELLRPSSYTGGKVELIDGQQRLTTLTIIYHVLLSMICSKYHPLSPQAKYYDESSLDCAYRQDRSTLGVIKQKCFKELDNFSIQEVLLKEDAIHQEMDSFKLVKQIKFDNNKHKEAWKIIFANKCNHEKNFEEFDRTKDKRTNGEVLLREAYEKIYKHLDALDENTFFSNWVVNFFNLDVKNSRGIKIKNRIHAAIMHTENPSNGIELFYGINALGKQLNPADLIKARIYDFARKHKSAGRDRTAEFMTRWEKLEDKLVKAFSTDDTSQFIGFLVTWITSATGKETREEKLFDAFEKAGFLKERQDIDILFQRLESESDLYLILRKRKGYIFNEEHIENTSSLNDVKTIILRIHLFLGPAAKQHLPILMRCFQLLRSDQKSSTLSYTDNTNIDYLTKISELVFKIMTRFKLADVEAKTLRVTLMNILAQLFTLDSEKPLSIYNTILNNAYQKILSTDLDEGESYKKLKNEDEVLVPKIRDKEIITRLSEPNILIQNKWVILFKRVLWEMEYSLESQQSSRRRLMCPDDIEEFTVTERSKYHGDHICPEKSDQYWKPLYQGAAYDGLLANKYSIGNYMLLFDKDNISSQNRELSHKIKHIYKPDKQVHKFLITSLVTEGHIQWTDSGEIEELKENQINTFWTKDKISQLKDWYLENILANWSY